MLVRLRIKTRIPCNRLRHPTQSALLLGNRRQEQSLIGGAFLKHFVIGDDLVLCFLQLHRLAKLVGLARLSLANDFRVRLKQADQLVRKLANLTFAQHLI